MKDDYVQLAVAALQKGNISGISHLHTVVAWERFELEETLLQHRFWFVAIPRTSSSSIQFRLGEQFGFPHGKQIYYRAKSGSSVPRVQSILLPPHTPAFLTRAILGPELWDICNTYSVVRNPYSWSVSMWRYVHTYGDLGFSKADFLTFLKEFQTKTGQSRTSRPWSPGTYFQHDWLVENDTNKFLVKNVLKFEQRDKIEEFLQSIGVKTPANQEHLMGTDSSNYSLSESERTMVRKVFEKDFELLGY